MKQDDRRGTLIPLRLGLILSSLLCSSPLLVVSKLVLH